jgi:AcrR family transcriptional regulator
MNASPVPAPLLRRLLDPSTAEVAATELIAHPAWVAGPPPPEVVSAFSDPRHSEDVPMPGGPSTTRQPPVPVAATASTRRSSDNSASRPISNQPRPERADAARNRRKILDAANHLLATVGVNGLSVEEIARLAEVGVGTVYRRFGDMAGLYHALLHERECELQVAFMTGPPPLGPGADPVQRIITFLHALLDRLEEQQELMPLAETNTPTARFTNNAYAVHHTHLVTLLGHADPDLGPALRCRPAAGPLSAGPRTRRCRVAGSRRRFVMPRGQAGCGG